MKTKEQNIHDFESEFNIQSTHLKCTINHILILKFLKKFISLRTKYQIPSLIHMIIHNWFSNAPLYNSDVPLLQSQCSRHTGLSDSQIWHILMPQGHNLCYFPPILHFYSNSRSRSSDFLFVCLSRNFLWSPKLYY